MKRQLIAVCTAFLKHAPARGCCTGSDVWTRRSRAIRWLSGVTVHAVSGRRPGRFQQSPKENGLVCSHDGGHRVHVGEQISLALKSKRGQSDSKGCQSSHDQTLGEHRDGSFSFSVLAGVLLRSSISKQMASHGAPEKAPPSSFFSGFNRKNSGAYRAPGTRPCPAGHRSLGAPGRNPCSAGQKN